MFGKHNKHKEKLQLPVSENEVQCLSQARIEDVPSEMILRSQDMVRISDNVLLARVNELIHNSVKTVNTVNNAVSAVKNS